MTSLTSVLTLWSLKLKTIITLLLLLLSGVSNGYAGQGGEGSNTECNGVGNPNSPCTGKPHQGGKPPTGGTPEGTGSAGATATITGGRNTEVTQTTTAMGTGGSVKIEYPKPVPNAYAPNIGVYSNNSCLKPGSLAGSGSGFGFSLGGTKEDKNCEIRMMSDLLKRFGMDDAALQVLCQSEYMYEAAVAVSKMRGEPNVCYKAPAKKKEKEDFDFYG